MLEIESFGFKISNKCIDRSLINACIAILPTILSDKKYIQSGLTFYKLYKSKPDRFHNTNPYSIPKDDLFIVSNPCEDYADMKNILTSKVLWGFAAECFACSSENIVLSFMNITRKPKQYSPTIRWHRDFKNKMTSTKSSKDMLRIIIPLEDTDTQNGTIEIVPDSHKIKDTAITDEYTIDSAFCERNCKSICLKAGEMFAFHSKLIHGSKINTGNTDRNYLIFQFVIRGSEHSYENITEPFYGLGYREIV